MVSRVVGRVVRATLRVSSALGCADVVNAARHLKMFVRLFRWLSTGVVPTCNFESERYQHGHTQIIWEMCTAIRFVWESDTERDKERAMGHSVAQHSPGQRKLN